MKDISPPSPAEEPDETVEITRVEMEAIQRAKESIETAVRVPLAFVE